MVARTAQIQPAETGDTQRSEFRPGRGPIDWLGGWRTGIVAPLIILALAFAWRIYQQFTAWTKGIDRSEEHTSELQSRENLVCRLLLEKKKNSFISLHPLDKRKLHPLCIAPTRL